MLDSSFSHRLLGQHPDCGEALAGILIAAVCRGLRNGLHVAQHSLQFTEGNGG